MGTKSLLFFALVLALFFVTALPQAFADTTDTASGSECRQVCTSTCDYWVTGSYTGSYCASYSTSCHEECPRNPTCDECKGVGVCAIPTFSADGSCECSGGCTKFGGSFGVGAIQDESGRLTGKGVIYSNFVTITHKKVGDEWVSDNYPIECSAQSDMTGSMYLWNHSVCNYTGYKAYNSLPSGTYSLTGCGEFKAFVDAKNDRQIAVRECREGLVFDASGVRGEQCISYSKQVYSQGCMTQTVSRLSFGGHNPSTLNAATQKKFDPSFEGYDLKVTLPDGTIYTTKTDSQLYFRYPVDQTGVYSIEATRAGPTKNQLAPLISAALQVGVTGCGGIFTPVFCNNRVYNNSCVAQKYGKCAVSEIVSTKKK